MAALRLIVYSSIGEVVGHELQQALGCFVPVRMLGTHLECDAALAATRDEALGAGRFDLLLLQLEDLVAQGRAAFFSHPAAAAAQK